MALCPNFRSTRLGIRKIAHLTQGSLIHGGLTSKVDDGIKKTFQVEQNTAVTVARAGEKMIWVHTLSSSSSRARSRSASSATRLRSSGPNPSSANKAIVLASSIKVEWKQYCVAVLTFSKKISSKTGVYSSRGQLLESNPDIIAPCAHNNNYNKHAHASQIELLSSNSTLLSSNNSAFIAQARMPPHLRPRSTR